LKCAALAVGMPIEKGDFTVPYLQKRFFASTKVLVVGQIETAKRCEVWVIKSPEKWMVFP
jgi:hypothetical protein